jgi:hypothetical protein
MSPTKAVPANLFCVSGKPFDEANELRIAPVAVTRQPHNLPGRSSDRQRHGAGEAAVEIAADRVRRPGKRRRFARKQLLGRRRRRVRILQRRQRLGIQRAGKHRVNHVFFLRDGRTRGGEEKDSKQPSDSAHQQLSSYGSVGNRNQIAPKLQTQRYIGRIRVNVRFCPLADIHLRSLIRG